MQAVTDDIEFIEGQNRGLQVQTSNQHALLTEIRQLLVSFSPASSSRSVLPPSRPRGFPLCAPAHLVRSPSLRVAIPSRARSVLCPGSKAAGVLCLTAASGSALGQIEPPRAHAYSQSQCRNLVRSPRPEHVFASRALSPFGRFSITEACSAVQPSPPPHPQTPRTPELLPLQGRPSPRRKHHAGKSVALLFNCS